MLKSLGMLSVRDMRLWFALLLALAVVLNAVFFPKIESLTNAQRTKAFSQAETADFIQLSFGNAHSRTRFDLYYTLGELAPDATVLLSVSAAHSEEMYRSYLYMLGNVIAVHETSTDDGALVALADIDGSALASGSGGSGGPPWSIYVASENSGDTLASLTDAFVTNAVAGDRSRGRGVAAGLTFLWVEVPLNSTDTRFDYEVLLIDTTLLTPPQAEPA